MIIKCFNEQFVINEYYNDEVSYTKCIVRNHKVRLLPEEKVRQAILMYMIHRSNISHERYIVKVEYNNLDIVVCHKQKIKQFQPAISPAFIIEIKRSSEDLNNHEVQLLAYLKINKCSNGMITNCNQIYLYRERNKFIKEIIDVNDIELHFPECPSDQYIDRFYQAQKGDVDSFISLVNIYGKTSRFKILCTHYKTPIEIFLITYEDNVIFFDFCGIRRKKRPNINKYDFIKLLSIRA